tara:strand:- start:2673 stop:3182 length:510 start_codon:yes stop_codon:yes gene_type:complete
MSLFLLFLAVSGNFVAETLGCKLQNLLSNNMFAKHVVIFFMIYFTLNYSKQENPHPFDSLKSTCLLYFFFVLFGRVPLSVFIITTTLLVITYVLNNYRDHYKSLNEKQENDKFTLLDDKLKNTQLVLLIITACLIIIGNIFYFIMKKKEYGKGFNFLTFIFGHTNCRNN